MFSLENAASAGFKSTPGLGVRRQRPHAAPSAMRSPEARRAARLAHDPAVPLPRTDQRHRVVPAPERHHHAANRAPRRGSGTSSSRCSSLALLAPWPPSAKRAERIEIEVPLRGELDTCRRQQSPKLRILSRVAAGKDPAGRKAGHLARTSAWRLSNSRMPCAARSSRRSSSLRWKA